MFIGTDKGATLQQIGLSPIAMIFAKPEMNQFAYLNLKITKKNQNYLTDYENCSKLNIVYVDICRIHVYEYINRDLYRTLSVKLTIKDTSHYTNFSQWLKLMLLFLKK